MLKLVLNENKIWCHFNSFFLIIKLQLFAQINKTNNLEIANITHFNSLLSTVNSNANATGWVEITNKYKDQNHVINSPISRQEIYSLRTDTSVSASKKRTVQITFFVSPMFANSMLIQTTKSPETMMGWGSVELGINYFVTGNNYLSLNMGAAQSLLVKGPTSRNHGYINSIAIRNNLELNKFDFGYGFCFTQNYWDSRIHNGNTDTSYSFSSLAMGLSFIGKFHFSKNFNFQLLYQLSIYSFGQSPSFLYQHLISFGIGVKLEIRRK